jgi:carbonic anhydrase
MKKISLLFLIILTSCTKIWSYDGLLGPQHWSGLKEEFKFCKIGNNQSPIDIKSAFKDEELKFSYSNSDVEKYHKNHVMQIEFDSRDFLLRGKKKYFVRHFEFHHPSEHLVDGKPHSLELQIYHKSEDEQWLALAIFLEVGKENSEFNSVIKFLSSKEKEGKIDLSRIVKENDQTFFYEGSLTTPPCSEGMKWYVMKTPIQVSKEQMNEIIKRGIFVKMNARPVQKFNPERY